MAEIGIWLGCAVMMGLFLWGLIQGINFFVILIVFLFCASMASAGTNLVNIRYRGLLPHDIEKN